MALDRVSCSVAECKDAAEVRGKCRRHYQREYQVLVRDKRREGAAKDCAHCGARMTGRIRKFCGAQCRDASAERARREKVIKPRPPNWVPITHQYFTCYWCEKEFKPRGSDRIKCCSRECGHEWLKFRQSVIRPVVYSVYRRKPKAAPSPRTCADCGTTIGRGVHRCEECKGARAKEVRSRARKKTRAKDRLSGRKAALRKARKLRLRGVKVEKVNPLEVLNRDGWRCQLCGVKTPKKLRGSYDDRAPEVDHILPIAQGGEHSYRNTQCACRKCNITKAGEFMGQMRLVG